MSIDTNSPNFAYQQLLELNQFSEQDLESQRYDELIGAISGTCPEITDLNPGSPTDMIAQLGTRLYVRENQYAGLTAAQAFVQNASGPLLTRAAKGFYQEDREPGQPNVGNIVLTLQSAGFGPYNFQPGDQSVSDGSNVWTNQTAFTLDGSNLVLSNPFECTLSGSQSNIANNVALTLQPSLNGVTVTNPPNAGSTTWITQYGTDDESDTKLRDVCLTKFATIQDGEISVDKLRHRVLKASVDIEYASVDDNNPRGPGTVNVFIAGATGAATDQSVLTVQSGTLNSTFFGNNESGLNVPMTYTPGNEPNNTTPGQRKQCYKADVAEFQVSGTVFYRGDLTSAQQVVTTALNDYVATIPIGGFNFPEAGLFNVVFFSDVETTLGSLKPTVQAFILNSETSEIFVPTNQKPVVPGNGWLPSLNFSKVK